MAKEKQDEQLCVYVVFEGLDCEGHDPVGASLDYDKAVDIAKDWMSDQVVQVVPVPAAYWHKEAECSWPCVPAHDPVKPVDEWRYDDFTVHIVKMPLV